MVTLGQFKPVIQFIVLAVREHTQDLAVAADLPLPEASFQTRQAIENGAVLIASLIFVPVMKMDGGLLTSSETCRRTRHPCRSRQRRESRTFDPEFLEFFMSHPLSYPLQG